MRVGLLAEEFTRLTDELASFSAETVLAAARARRRPRPSRRGPCCFSPVAPATRFATGASTRPRRSGWRAAPRAARPSGRSTSARPQDRYAAFVLHRVAWDDAIERLVGRARAAGKPVIFETDDLVFEPEALPFVVGARRRGRARAPGVRRERRALSPDADRRRRGIA